VVSECIRTLIGVQCNQGEREREREKELGVIMLIDWCTAGTNVVRPVPGHSSPGQLTLSANSAQHRHRGRTDVGGRIARQRSSDLSARRRRLLLRRTAALALHQRQYLHGPHSQSRSPLLRLLLRLRLRVPAVGDLPLVRTTVVPFEEQSKKSDGVSAGCTSVPVRRYVIITRILL